MASSLGVVVVAALAFGLWMTRRAKQSLYVNARLAATERALRTLTDGATDLIRVINDVGNLTYVSPSCEPVLGFTQKEMLAMPPRALLHEDDREAAFRLIQQANGEQAEYAPFLHRLRTRAGEYRWFETRYSSLKTESGATQVYLASRDVTERKLAEDELRRYAAEQCRAAKALQESEERLRVLSEASFEGVAITNAGVIVDVNTHFAAWFAKSPAEMIGSDGLSLFAPEDRKLVLEKSTQSGIAYEASMLRADGSRFPVEIRGRHAMLAGQTVRISAIRDITDRRRREAELKHRADLLRSLYHRDELTHLYNRVGLLERVDHWLQNADGRSACLFLADVDGMRAINDELGHELGDRVLVAAGRALAEVFESSDIAARLGGDEFCVFAPTCSENDVAVVLERIQDRLFAHNRAGREPFQLALTVGYAVFDPALHPTAVELLHGAKHVLEKAKQQKARMTRSHARSLSPGGHRQRSATR